MRIDSLLFILMILANVWSCRPLVLTLNIYPDATVEEVTGLSYSDHVVKDVEKIITLPYTATLGSLATSCQVMNLDGVVQTTPCSCDALGVCTVGLTVSSTSTATFDFTISTDKVTSNVGKGTLEVTSTPNTAPVAADLTPVAAYQTVEKIYTLSYTDIDGDLATACSVTNLANATQSTLCSCNGSGVCTVGITGSSVGAASFDYTVTANASESNTATVTLNIPNAPPVAADLTPVAAYQAVEKIYTLSYTDIDGDLATTCSVTNLINATQSTLCSCNGSGVCTVGITGSSVGAASFDYTVTTNATQSNTATVTLNIPNAPPVAADLTPVAAYQTVEKIYTLSYTDIDGDLATTCTVTNLINATQSTLCSCNGSGVCTVGITGSSVGAASFDYTVTTNATQSNTATVTLNIPNAPPVAEDLTLVAAYQTVEKIYTLSYTDIDGDLATACTVTNLINATQSTLCSCNGSGVCTVGITGSSVGAASFDYTVTTNATQSNTATVTLNIPNAPPVAEDLTPVAAYQTVEKIYTLSYTDIDGDLATACTVTNLINATQSTLCSCNGSGVCTVGITGSSVGAASFDYTVTTNATQSNTATVTLNIPNAPPVAADLTPVAAYQTVEKIYTLSYTDIDGDLATTCTVTNLINATQSTLCSCNGSGVCTVGITGSSVGAASFDYTVTTNATQSNTATVTLNIPNAPPVAEDLTPVAAYQTVEKIYTLSYTDIDGDLATACTVTNLINATQSTLCSCNGSGVCTVGITGSSVGAASFDYTVTTNATQSNTATVTLNIPNAPPVAEDLTPTGEYQSIEKIYTLSYTDIDGDLATACSVTNLVNATQSTICSCNGAGVCTVGITGSSFGAASFDYTVTTNATQSNTATVTLTIDQIGSSINDVWIKVPANAGGMGLDEFYVMKYEARAWMKKDSGATANEDNIIDVGEVDSDGLGTVTTTNNWVELLDPNAEDGDATDYLPVSIATSLPWREIDAYNAALRCQGLGANYQLISNKHWMAIARDVENQSQNWTGGAVGLGCLFRGNTGEAATGDGSNLGDSCGYNGANPEEGITRDRRAIHTLSNGSQIYDFAGNVREWTDWEKDTSNYQSGPITCAAGWQELPDVNCLALVADDYFPTIPVYTSIDGVGRFYGDNGGGTVRGGMWNHGVGAGVFALHLDLAPTHSSEFVGLRCILVKPAPDTPPVAADLTPAGEYQSIEKTYTLSYTDIDGDLATACSVTNLVNATQSTICSCNGAGVCTVGITGSSVGAASFDYTVTTNATQSNTATVTLTIDQIGSSINDVWIKVPANAGGMGLDEFYVMKYEARAWMKKDPGATSNEDNIIDAGEVDANGLGAVVATDNWVEVLDPNAAEGDATDYLPVSIATSLPWREIDANNAALRCQGLGANYQLISNEHWIAIARDLENQSQNWTGGAVGSGCLFRGNSGEGTVGDGSHLGDSCGYDGANPEEGTTRDLRAIYTLSNGSKIYDLAGNSWEWVDWDKDTPNFQLGPVNCEVSSELPDISSDLTCDLTEEQYLPSAGYYTSTDGVGTYQGGIGGAAFRSGGTNDMINAGLFMLNLDHTQVESYGGIGFRCILVIPPPPPPNTPAVADDLTPTGEYQMIEKIYTLSYTDVDGDLATDCTVSNFINVTQTTVCSCNGSGVCTVGMTGSSPGMASFDYTVTTNGVESNTAIVTLIIDHIGTSVNDEWIKIPANAGGMGLDAFYVMKYEARAWMKSDPGVTSNEDNIIDAGEVDADGLGAVTTTDNWAEILDPNAEEGDATDYLPVSIATSLPWSEIDAENAALRCQSLGTNYQLISNAHWMAIARDLEAQGENWTGGAVGSGCLFRGNTGEASIGDGTNVGDSCGYNGTNPEAGASRDLRASHTLSTGVEIYDLAGNLDEWTDWKINDPLTPSTLNFTLGPNFVDGNECPSSGELGDIVDCPALNNDDYRPLYPDPSPNFYSVLGFGLFSSDVSSGGAALRGGNWTSIFSAGLFTLNLESDQNVSESYYGFRCVLVNPTSDTQAVAADLDLTLVGGYQLIEKTYTLSYTDINSDLATACTVTNLINATQSTSCSCNGAGVCSVGITGSSVGAASFNYTVTTNGVQSNTATATLTINQIGASINEEWIKVPADAGGMGLDEFYVMKYEARAWTDSNTNNTIDAGEVDADGCNEAGCTTANWGLTNRPVSISTNLPWRKINATNAALRCQALGANYKLISNEHWMAIARDIEEQPQNWTGDGIGSGCLFRGNTGETSTGDGSTLGDSCGYNGSDPEAGTTRDLRAIHTLSNGLQIFDFAGNLWEWTDWNKDVANFQIGPTTCPNWGFEELPDVSCAELLHDQYLPITPTYTSIDGVGQFDGGSGGAALRGGSYSALFRAGVFMLELYFTTTYTTGTIGFRCILVP